MYCMETRKIIRIIMAMTVVLSTVLAIAAMGNNEVMAVSSIDENTVITVEQAGSIADHIGDYGWDSRGAYITYHDDKGRISGDLGLVMFCDENMIPRDRMWDKWNDQFPDWWGRMLADKIRKNVSVFKLDDVREAFADSVTFECKWVIAIGIKDNSIGSGPYLTLRNDGTLRAAYNVNTSALYPAEKLYAGDEMADSLSEILPGEKWGTTSQHVFKERNPYIYKVTIKSYMIKLWATDCVKCAKKGKLQGEYCSHNKKELMLKEIPLKYGNSVYGGSAAFAWEGQEAHFTEPMIQGYTRVAASDDRSGLHGTISVSNGTVSVNDDSVVYLVYKSEQNESPDTPGSPTPGPSVTPTSTPTGTPTSAPTDTPTSTPGPSPSDTPTPTPTQPIYDPIPDNESQNTYENIRTDAMDTMGKAVIYSDVFDVRNAIPSTESVYIRASARNFIYRINAGTVSGTVPIEVTVAVPYILRWQDESGNENEETGITETRTVIYRDYSYIHLDSLEAYTMDGIVIANPALSPAVNELKPEQVNITMPSFSAPVVYGTKTPSFGRNIDYPSGFSSYILSGETIVVDGGTNKPAIPIISAEEAYWTAENRTGKLRCRNDEFRVDSRNVLGESGWHEYGRGSLSIRMPNPEIVEFDTKSLYGENHITIPAAVRNGTYQASSRLVRYSLKVSYGYSGAPFDAMLEVNPVVVHTPVYCGLTIGESDGNDPNRSYFQENGNIPDNAFMIIQGRSNSLGSEGFEHKTEDFVITLSNSGYHPVYAGRLSGTYNYSSNVSRANGGTYVEGNYLRFPFDVYMDIGNDGIEANDRLIRKNEWVRFSGSARFYPGEVISEGYYTIEARTRAVNSVAADDTARIPPQNVNANDNEYIVTDSIRVYVSGKLYGLTLYDISSKAEWDRVFTDNNINKYLRYIPQLAANMTWPANDGTRRSSSADGRYSSSEISSKIFYFTAGTGNEIGIDTGRSSKYTFPIAAGSHPDRSKSNKGVLKTGYRWKFRLRSTGKTMGLEGSRIEIDLSFRLADNPGRTGEVMIFVPNGRGSLSEMSDKITIPHCTDDKNGMQIWDFEVFIPQGCRMICKNEVYTLFGKQYQDFRSYMTDKVIVDPGDDVWLKEGTVIMNFEIRAVSPSGRVLYTYSPGTESCNMWKIEGQSLEKTDFYGNRYRLRYGDIALISVNKGALTDYITDHQN